MRENVRQTKEAVRNFKRGLKMFMLCKFIFLLKKNIQNKTYLQNKKY